MTDLNTPQGGPVQQQPVDPAQQPGVSGEFHDPEAYTGPKGDEAPNGVVGIDTPSGGYPGPETDPGTGYDVPNHNGGLGDRPTGTQGPTSDPGTGHDTPTVGEMQPSVNTQREADEAYGEPNTEATVATGETAPSHMPTGTGA